MICEYPKEFIVPVSFAEDLLQKRNVETRECNKTNKDKIKYEIDNYKYNIVLEIESENDIKTILNKIDEEYVESETLRN
jgi:hypothetical protein